MSIIIDGLVEIRQGSDYDDFYLVSKEEVELQLKNAEEFVDEIEKYLRIKFCEFNTHHHF